VVWIYITKYNQFQLVFFQNMMLYIFGIIIFCKEYKEDAEIDVFDLEKHQTIMKNMAGYCGTLKITSTVMFTRLQRPLILL